MNQAAYFQLVIKQRWFAKKKNPIPYVLEHSCFQSGMYVDGVFQENTTNKKDRILYRENQVGRGINIYYDEKKKITVLSVSIPTTFEEIDDLFEVADLCRRMTPSDIYLKNQRLLPTKIMRARQECQNMNKRLLQRVLEAVDKGMIPNFTFLACYSLISFDKVDAAYILEHMDDFKKMLHQRQENGLKSLRCNMFEHNKEEGYLQTFYYPIENEVWFSLDKHMPLEFYYLGLKNIEFPILMWRIELFDHEESLGYVLYDDFVEFVKKEGYVGDSTNHVFLKPFSKEKILALIESKKQENMREKQQIAHVS